VSTPHEGPGFPVREGADRLLVPDERAVAYAAAHSLRPTALIEQLVEETERELSDRSVMLTGVFEGGVLAALVHATRARHVLEVGTFTGRSALAIAAELPEGGRITTCEVDPEAAALARRHFEASPYRDRIDLRVGPAAETIAGLPGPFDVVFIDANKSGYLGYYEAVVPKLASHGIVAVDNTLWGGSVADPGDSSEIAEQLRAFNDHVASDPRTRCILLPMGDGLTLIWLGSQESSRSLAGS
jgi:caffeoyl-CoA O-methyltransferase